MTDKLRYIPCKGGWGGGTWKWHRCICSATRGVSHRRTWERKLWGSSVIGDDCNYTKQPEINVGRRTNKTTCPLPPSCESISCSPSGSSPAKLSESVQLDQFQGGLFESKYLDRLEYQGWQLEAWDELVRTMVLKQSLDCNLGENVHRHWFDLIGVFSSWAIQNIQVGYPRKQEFHIRYNRQTTMVENNDHLL